MTPKPKRKTAPRVKVSPGKPREEPVSGRLYTVLTGDVVASSRYSPAIFKRLMRLLKHAAERFNRVYPDVVRGQLDVFSGDSWQVLVTDCEKSVRLALFLRAVVKAERNLATDTRVSIGLGPVDRLTLNPGKISESTGRAFERSGRALAAMDKTAFMTWAASDGGRTPEERLMDGSLQLLDELVRRWKPRQAQTVSLALLGTKQAQIARRLNISQPTVSASLAAAGWRGIECFLAEVEQPGRTIRRL